MEFLPVYEVEFILCRHSLPCIVSDSYSDKKNNVLNKIIPINNIFRHVVDSVLEEEPIFVTKNGFFTPLFKRDFVH